MARAAGDRGRDEAVRGSLQQRHLLARRRAQGIGVATPPVLVDQRAVAQVADAGRAPAQEGAEHPRLGQRVKRLGGHVSPLLERRAQVWRAQRDHVPDALGPALRRSLTPGGRRCALPDRPSSDPRARSLPPPPAMPPPAPRAAPRRTDRSQRRADRCCSADIRGCSRDPRPGARRRYRPDGRHPNPSRTHSPSGRAGTQPAAPSHRGTPRSAEPASSATASPSTRTEAGW